MLRFAPLLALGFSVAALAGALIGEHVFGLKPCILCIYQRIPFAIIIVLSLLAMTPIMTRFRRLITALFGLLFLAGAGIAAFHTGVERKWWQGTSGCGATGGAQSVEELLRQIEAAPVVRCDTIPWDLFGLSMANYNFFYSLALGLAFLLLARDKPYHTP
jgi:disulfide bond formation protein DsbB